MCRNWGTLFRGLCAIPFSEGQIRGPFLWKLVRQRSVNATVGGFCCSYCFWGLLSWDGPTTNTADGDARLYGWWTLTTCANESTLLKTRNWIDSAFSSCCFYIPSCSWTRISPFFFQLAIPPHPLSRTRTATSGGKREKKYESLGKWFRRSKRPDPQLADSSLTESCECVWGRAGKTTREKGTEEWKTFFVAFFFWGYVLRFTALE